MTTWWATSDSMLTPEIEKQVADGPLRMAGNRSIEEREGERDTMLMEFLATRSETEKAAQAVIATGGGTPARNK